MAVFDSQGITKNAAVKELLHKSSRLKTICSQIAHSSRSFHGYVTLSIVFASGERSVVSQTLLFVMTTWRGIFGQYTSSKHRSQVHKSGSTDKENELCPRLLQHGAFVLTIPSFTSHVTVISINNKWMKKNESLLTQVDGNANNYVLSKYGQIKNMIKRNGFRIEVK